MKDYHIVKQLYGYPESITREGTARSRAVGLERDERISDGTFVHADIRRLSISVDNIAPAKKSTALRGLTLAR